MNKFLKGILATGLAFSLVACSNSASNEPAQEEEAAEEEAVEEETEEETAEETVETALAKYEVYNKTGENLTDLYVYENGGDKGTNYAEELSHGHVTIDLGELTTDKEFTLEYTTESGRVGSFTTLHVEEAPITLLAEDDMTGATQISFTEPNEDGIYSIYNDTGDTVTELYIYPNSGSDKGENYAEGGLANGTKVVITKDPVPASQASHMYNLEFVTEGGYEGKFETLSQEIASISLIAEDAMTGATQIAFAKPEWAANETDVYFTATYGAAHGTKCFSTAAVAVTADGTIVDAFLDEYQYMDAEGNTGVPNSDATEDGFAASYAEGKVLGSKKVNHEAYSAHMAEAAGATQDIKASYEAIEEFVKGKTLDELASVDEVTGSTLADTAGYVTLIVDTAKAAMGGKAYTVDSTDNLVVNVIDTAAHGNKCFTYVADLVDGDKIVATYIDEFQYSDASAEGITPVPNGTDTENFASGNAEDKVLISKKVNHESYSAHMAEAAGATQDIKDSYEAIEAFVAGKTVGELGGVDEVTGSTLADTANYVAAAVEAASNSK